MHYQHIDEIKRRRVYLEETYFLVVDFIEIYSKALNSAFGYKKDYLHSTLKNLALRKEVLVRELHEVDTMISDRIPFQEITLQDYMFGDIKVTTITTINNLWNT